MSPELQSGYKHCLRRAVERFHYHLSILEYLQICGRIQQGIWRRIEKEFSGSEKYRIQIGNFTCVGVFDPVTKTLRTLLTL
jgi:hypothetical protein